LKGRSLWQIPILKSCSWSWKKLLRLRDIAKTFIHYQIGDGSQIFLWYDHWHPAGYLLDTYGFWVVYDVFYLLKKDWFWPSARSEDLVAIQSKLPEIILGDTDKSLWNSSRGTYSCA